MLFSMEKSAGGEIVSNLCSFQAKESQPHSLLGGEAVGRGYAPPTLWSQRSQRKKQLPVNESGVEELPPARSPTPHPQRGPQPFAFPFHEQTQPLSKEDDGHCKGFTWHH